MELHDLPLFPLGTVLFPGYGLPLHIFEERYKALITDCQAGAGQFGVVGIERGIEVGGEAQPYRVGTLAVITELERLPDGRFTLLAAGLERIRILDLVATGKPYLRGRVVLWPDEDVPPAPSTESAQAGTLFNKYLRAILAATSSESEGWGVQLPLDLPTDPRLLSGLIGTLIQAPPADKQRLLEAPSAGARIAAEIDLLARELTLMKTTQAAPTPNPAALRGSFSNN